jgi:threonine dehydrogenase-like Zn-dependent dehydrogenase
MNAACWMGKRDIQVQEVPDPTILNDRDAIVRITSTAICGSDLHLYNGFIPTMQKGDVVGHEFMGEVVEVGPGVHNLRTGDRVVVPFTISCGSCLACESQLFSVCENTNPNAWMAEKLWGYSPAGLFGYSHLLGGFAGGQAQYARVPFADIGPIKIEDGLPDEQVLLLSDILPTGYMGAELCDIKRGDVIAVWGCGPVGLLAIKSAFVLGAERAIAIDRVPYRLRMAREKAGRRDNQLRGDRRPRRAQGDDRRTWTGCLHRRRWPGGAHARGRLRVRSWQAGDWPGDRPADGAAPGDHGLSQRRGLSR